MTKSLFKIFTNIVVILCIGYIFWLGWTYLGPQRSDISLERERLADRVLPAILDDIRQNRGTVREATVFHFYNDPSSYVSNSFRQSLEESGILTVSGSTFITRLRDLLQMPMPAYATLEEAIAKGREMKTESIIYGSINTFEALGDVATIDLDVYFVDMGTGRILFQQQYVRESRSIIPRDPGLEDDLARYPLFQRLVAWVFAVLSLPIITLPFLRFAANKYSTNLTLAVLSLYTLANAVLAWFLIGAKIDSWFSALLFLGALFVATIYNSKMMVFARETTP